MNHRLHLLTDRCRALRPMVALCAVMWLGVSMAQPKPPLTSEEAHRQGQEAAKAAMQKAQSKQQELEASKSEYRQLQRNRQMTPENLQAHEDAKAMARGSVLDHGAADPRDLVSDKRARETMNDKALQQIPEQGNNGAAGGARAKAGRPTATGARRKVDTDLFELTLFACEDAVRDRNTRNKALSDLCMPLTSPATNPADQSRQAELASRIVSLCDAIVDGNLAPKTDFGNHCIGIVASQAAAAAFAAARPSVVLGTLPAVNMQEHYNPQPDPDAVTINYPGCATPDCGGQIAGQACSDGRCWDAGYKADADVGNAAAGLETAREGGRYASANDGNLFAGTKAVCKDFFIVPSCCKDSGLRDTLLGPLNIAKSIHLPEFEGGGPSADGAQPDGEKGLTDENNIPLISDRTEDFIFSNENAGFAAAGLRTLSSLGAEGQEVFDAIKDQDYKKAVFKLFIASPYDLAQDLSVDLANLANNLIHLGGLIPPFCDEADSITREKIKKELCVEVGHHCSEHTAFGLGPCEHDDYNFCCFNSVLARVINTQGRALILTKHGRAAGDANQLFVGSVKVTNRTGTLFGRSKSFNCTGFTVDEIALIDFAQIDFTEYIASLKINGGRGSDSAKVVDRVLSQLSKCTGGSAQCEADKPPPGTLSDQRFVGIGAPAGGAAPAQPTAAVEPGIAPAAKNDTRMLLSLRPLYRQAFTEGRAMGLINNEDIRQVSKYRFRGSEAPIRAEVVRGNPHPKMPNCSFMNVFLRQQDINSTWTDVNIKDPTAANNVNGYRPLRPGEVAPTNTFTREGMKASSVVTYCSDGRVM